MRAESTIRINGTPRPLRARLLVEILPELGIEPDAPGIAIAVNGALVPRREWARHLLAPGDAVEIVGAVQGG